MQKTNIAWTEFSANPIIGCEMPLVSKGCTNCYARELHNQRHEAYKEGKKLPEQYAKPFEVMQFFPDRLDKILRRKKPTTIFLDSMCDMFCDGVPFEWLDKVMAVIALCPQHKFVILSKRMGRMYEYFNSEIEDIPVDDRIDASIMDGGYNKNFQWPLPNLILGCSISNQKDADEMIPILLQIPATKRILSIEPLLGDIELYDTSEGILEGIAVIKSGGMTISTPYNPPEGYDDSYSGIDHVIIGSESGHKRRPCKLEWVKNLIDQCKAADVKIYVKQLDINGKVSHNPDEWMEWARIRDEL